jgi:hypothetical protein
MDAAVLVADAVSAPAAVSARVVAAVLVAVRGADRAAPVAAAFAALVPAATVILRRKMEISPTPDLECRDAVARDSVPVGAVRAVVARAAADPVVRQTPMRPVAITPMVSRLLSRRRLREINFNHF